MELLQDQRYSKVFTEVSLSPKDEVVLIYKIYFQLTYPKEAGHLIKKGNKSDFWNFVHHHFIDNNDKIGNCVKEDLKKCDFSMENLYIINRLLTDQSKFTPNYYTKLCGTSGLFVFFLKDILEWAGIICEKKANPYKAISLYDYSIDYLTTLLKNINQN